METAAPMCRDWLTGGGVPRVFGRALGQENSFSHQTINLRRTLTNPTDRVDFGAWFLLVSAAFVLNYLRCAFLFRGSFSNPDPGISSARLSTISHPPLELFLDFFPPTEKKKKKRTNAQRGKEEERLSPAQLGLRGTKGSRPPERGSVEHPLAPGRGGAEGQEPPGSGERRGRGN